MACESEKKVSVATKEPSCESERKPFFVIKEQLRIASWSFDINMDTCAICRNNIMDLCIECNASGLDVNSTKCLCYSGTCNHVFHGHCITRWLKTRQVCPICDHPWETQKVHDNSTSIITDSHGNSKST
jgi:RING-box protein 1